MNLIISRAETSIKKKMEVFIMREIMTKVPQYIEDPNIFRIYDAMDGLLIINTNELSQNGVTVLVNLDSWRDVQ